MGTVSQLSKYKYLQRVSCGELGARFSVLVRINSEEESLLSAIPRSFL